MKTNAVSVHVTTPVSDDPGTDLRSLSERERMRVARFHNREGAAHWMACRAALRRILGQTLGLPPSHVPIVLTELGKPVLDSGFQHIHFNLTHCHDLTLVAISTSGPVGIDVEPLDRAPDLVECIETFCHPEEIRNLPKNPDALAPRLLEIWTAKEALLKAIGTGFTHAPDQLRIHFGTDHHTGVSDSPLESIEGLRIHTLQHPALNAHSVQLAAPESCTEIEIIPHLPAVKPRATQTANF